MNHRHFADIKESGRILAQAAALSAQSLRQGITPLSIDSLIHKYIISQNAQPSFLGFEGYTYSSCISVNNVLVHGIPSIIPLKNGDVVSVDLGVKYNKWHTDGAFSVSIGTIPTHIHRAINTTRDALYEGIQECVAGKRVGDISSAIQKTAQRGSLCIIKELTGHGIGKNLHEQPNIPNRGARGTGVLLKPGMLLAIEPMFAVPLVLGKTEHLECPITSSHDGWSILLNKNLIGTHFEHTVCITDAEPIIITSLVDSHRNVW